MSVPTDMLWGNKSWNTSLTIGSGGIITMPRSDGFNDGFNIIQGVRVYDGTVNGWSTPDTYQGDVDSPMSQKNYVWNNNNPITSQDPSGLCGDEDPNGWYACVGVRKTRAGEKIITDEMDGRIHPNEQSAERGRKWAAPVGQLAGGFAGSAAGDTIAGPARGLVVGFGGAKVGELVFGEAGARVGAYMYGLPDPPDWWGPAANVIDNVDTGASGLKVIANVVSHSARWSSFFDRAGLNEVGKMMHALYGGNDEMGYCWSCDQAGMNPYPGGAAPPPLPQ